MLWFRVLPVSDEKFGNFIYIKEVVMDFLRFINYKISFNCFVSKKLVEEYIDCELDCYIILEMVGKNKFDYKYCIERYGIVKTMRLMSKKQSLDKLFRKFDDIELYIKMTKVIIREFIVIELY
jgi:hypothetical protein